MLQQNRRLEGLLQTAPPALRTRFQRILSAVQAPPDADHIRSCTANLVSALVRLCNEIPAPQLKSLLLDALSLQSFVSDHLALPPARSYQRAVDQLEPVYAALSSTLIGKNEEAEAIHTALVLTLFSETPDLARAKVLASVFHNPPVLPPLPIPVQAPVAWLPLISLFLTEQAGSNREEKLKSAMALDAVIEDISRLGADESLITIAIQNRQTIYDSLNERGERLDNPTHKLKKLFVQVITKAGQSIREIHRPAHRMAPSCREVIGVLEFLESRDPTLCKWLQLNILLSKYAELVLDSPADSRASFGKGLIKIIAPKTERQAALSHGNADMLAVKDQLFLPLPASLLKLGDRLCAEGMTQQAGRHKFNQEMQNFRNQFGRSHSLGSIHRLLQIEIGNGQIDQTTSYLLGFDEHGSRDSGIHYFSPSADVLVEKFKAAVTRLANEIGINHHISDGWSEVAPQPYCYGRSPRPNPQHLSALLATLDEARKLGRGKPTLEKRLRAFNASASAITLLYLASTAGRPTGHVFPGSAQLFVPDLLALASEKDSLLYRSTRLLPLPAELIDMRKQFIAMKQSLEVESGKRLDHDSSVFLLDSTYTPLSPTVDNMKRLVPEFATAWSWEADILRHHFRSRMWELGCPPLLLDRLMGHLGKSQTPDNRFAMKPIADHLPEGAPFIRELLNELRPKAH